MIQLSQASEPSGCGFFCLGVAPSAGLADDGDGGGEALVEDIAHRSWAAIAGIDQLEDAHGGGEGHGGETEQVFGLLDLALLQPFRGRSLLEGSEDLLDAPAQAVERTWTSTACGASSTASVVKRRQSTGSQPGGGSILTGFDEPERELRRSLQDALRATHQDLL